MCTFCVDWVLLYYLGTNGYCLISYILFSFFRSFVSFRVALMPIERNLFGKAKQILCANVHLHKCIRIVY